MLFLQIKSHAIMELSLSVSVLSADNITVKGSCTGASYFPVAVRLAELRGERDREETYEKKSNCCGIKTIGLKIGRSEQQEIKTGKKMK